VSKCSLDAGISALEELLLAVNSLATGVDVLIGARQYPQFFTYCVSAFSQSVKETVPTRPRT
jgi:hypothetical protein